MVISCEESEISNLEDLSEIAIIDECILHSKKLEAFCEKDASLLCIDCILSDQHKGHDIFSI